MAYSFSSNERNFMKETLKHYGYSTTDIDSVLQQHNGPVKFEVALQELQDLKAQKRIMLCSKLPIESMETVIISSDSESSDVEMQDDSVLVTSSVSKTLHKNSEVSDTALKCAMLDLPPVEDIYLWMKKNYLVAQFEAVRKEDLFLDFRTYFQRPNYAELRQVFFTELSTQVFSENQEYENVWMSGENESAKIWGLKLREPKQTLQRDINTPSYDDVVPTTAQKEQLHMKPEISRTLYSMPSTSRQEKITISNITEPKYQSRIYPTLPVLPNTVLEKETNTEQVLPSNQQEHIDSKKSISKTIKKVFTTKPKPVPLPRKKVHSPIGSPTREKVSPINHQPKETISSKIQDVFKPNPIANRPSASKKEIRPESFTDKKAQQDSSPALRSVQGTINQQPTNSQAVSLTDRMYPNSPSNKTFSYTSPLIRDQPVKPSYKESYRTPQPHPTGTKLIFKPKGTPPSHSFDKLSSRQELDRTEHVPSVASSSHNLSTKKLLELPNTPGLPNLRPIVIDGSNVACDHGNNGRRYSCRGIAICVSYFWQRGHRDITCFVPNFRKGPSGNPPISEQSVLYDLEQKGICKFTPSRKVNGVNKICYDDRYILRLAETNGGVVVSNDQYRDLRSESLAWKQVIENRLLMFVFVHDLFMPPDDPLGSGGPHLDDFLSFSKRTFQNVPSQRVTHRKDHFSTSPKQLAVDHPAQSVKSKHKPNRDQLAAELRVLFPGMEETINKTLRLHPGIHDLNILADLIFDD